MQRPAQENIVSRDKTLHNLRVTNSNKIPYYSSLATVGGPFGEPGMQGNIVLDLSGTGPAAAPGSGPTFYGHNGVMWVPLGGAGAVEPLDVTLAEGNESGGTDIVMTNGDLIRGETLPGTGGALSLLGGLGTLDSGDVNIQTPTTTNLGGDTGTIFINTGPISVNNGTGNTGAVNINTGDSSLTTNGTSGAINLSTGPGSGEGGGSGSISIQTGIIGKDGGDPGDFFASTANGGGANVGTGATSKIGGNINLTTGSGGPGDTVAGNEAGGSIVLKTGDAGAYGGALIGGANGGNVVIQTGDGISGGAIGVEAQGGSVYVNLGNVGTNTGNTGPTSEVILRAASNASANSPAGSVNDTAVHIIVEQQDTPLVSANVGTPTMNSVSTDAAGIINSVAANSTVTVTFHKSYNNIVYTVALTPFPQSGAITNPLRLTAINNTNFSFANDNNDIMVVHYQIIGLQRRSP